jgi:hypothetical protein
VRQDDRCDLAVVVEQVALGQAGVGPEDLLAIGQDELVLVGFESLLEHGWPPAGMLCLVATATVGQFLRASNDACISTFPLEVR